MSGHTQHSKKFAPPTCHGVYHCIIDDVFVCVCVFSLCPLLVYTLWILRSNCIEQIHITNFVFMRSEDGGKLAPKGKMKTDLGKSEGRRGN